METDEDKMTDTVIWRQLKTIKYRDRQDAQIDKKTVEKTDKNTNRWEIRVNTRFLNEHSLLHS